MDMTRYFLGIDIGGTKCAICLGTNTGDILEKISFATEQENGPQHCIDKFIRYARQLITKHQIDLTAIGISCGSPLDSKCGLIQAPIHLPTWINIPIVSIFQKEFSVAAYLENDANAGALAEFEFGAGQGYKHLAFLTFGTGLGAGLILNGQIYQGANNNAGEIGHMRIANDGPVCYHKAGSFESFCSGTGIALLGDNELTKWNGESSLRPGMNCKNIGQAADAGDALARHILAYSGSKLGEGLALINDLLNLERVIIGSVFLRCEQFLRPAMEAALNKEGLAHSLTQLEIVAADLGEQIGDYAAIAVAKHNHPLHTQSTKHALK